ncbi:hypothetical protein ACFFRR_003267 [Megaselia abdita]
MTEKNQYSSVSNNTVLELGSGEKCSVQSCCRRRLYNSKYAVDYLTFPKAQKILDLWIAFCGVPKGWTPSASSFICESHFSKNDSGFYFMIPTRKFGKEVFQPPDEYKDLLYDSELDPDVVYEEDFDDDSTMIEYVIEENPDHEDSIVEYVVEDDHKEVPEVEETVLIPTKLPTEYPPISVTILSNITTNKIVQQQEVSQLLMEYVNTIKEHDFPFNRLTLSNEAMAIADFLGYKNFVVSSDWMSKFTNTCNIKFTSPVQDVFDEKAFYLLRMGGDDFYFHRDLAKKLQSQNHYPSIEKKYGKAKMFHMIKTLNTFTRLHCKLNDRLIQFMIRCPLLDGRVLHKKALIIAKRFGFESYVGSFAGLWSLLSKTSIKFNRVMGRLPENNASYYDDDDVEDNDNVVSEEFNEEVEYETENIELCNEEPIPEDAVDIIEISPENTQEYVMEMIPSDNMTEEIVFLEDQAFHYELEEHSDERGTKRSIDEDGLYTTTVKRGRIDGGNFDSDLDFNV